MTTNGRTRAQISKATLLAATALFAALASPAGAQDATTVDDAQANEAAPTTSDEIIVTGTRRSESVRDVPFNIQAISADTLAKTGATELTDFVRTVPGVSLTDGGPRDGVRLVLRGLRTGGESGLRPTTTVYVDEIPVDMPYRGSPLDLKLLDIDRVEILRGPQGTLFGGGAIGGTLRYISKKPDLDEMEGRAGGELSVTEHGGVNYNITGMLNVPVADWIAVRANIGQFDNDGFIDNVRLGTDNINDDRTLSGRISVLAKPVEDLDISLTYYRQNSRYGEFTTVRESRPELTVDFYHPGRSRYRAQLGNLTFGYDFGWAKLTSSSSYVDEREDAINDVTFYIRDVIMGSFLDPTDIPEFTEFTERRARSHSFTQEIRLVSNNGSPLSWIAGAYYNKVRMHETQQERVPVPFPGQAAFERDVIGAELNDDLEYMYDQVDRSREYALFGELKYNFTDAWQASVGGRYFDIRGAGDFYTIDQWFGRDARDAGGLGRRTPLPEEFSIGENREKGSVWRFNTSYKLGGDGLIYTTIAQGYRPGGFNLVTPNTGIPPEGRQYSSDDLISYELGTKFSLLRNKVYISSALYRIDWSDIQTTVQTPIGFPYLSNAGKAVSQGLEVEMNAQDVVLRGMSLNAGYAYTDAKLTETITGIGFEGERMPLVPRHALSLMTDYSRELNRDLNGGITLLATYTSSSHGDFGRFQPVRDPITGEPVRASTANRQYLKLDAYWLTSLSFRLESDTWTARFFADNLFNVQYKTGRRYLRGNSPFSGPDVQYSANRPRTIGLELTKRF
jgi:iron complex outermembrane receptor protein